MRSPSWLRIDEAGIVLDRTVFYPLGGGQAGDSGVLVLADGRELAIADTRKAKDAEGKPTARHRARAGARARTRCWPRCSPATRVTARIDWERRHKLMRFHTATHLLCHLVPQPVNGCSITPDYARLDFHMTDPLDKEALTAGIARLVAAGHPLAVGAITDDELDANPALVKSMSVQPPRGTGTRAHHPHRRRGRTDRFPALRRHPCGEHARDRRGGGDQDREEERHAPAAWCWAGLHERRPELRPPAELRLTACILSPLRFAIAFAGRPRSLPAWPRRSWRQTGPWSRPTRVRAELMAHAPEGVAPGKPVWVGLQITHQPEWHTYWKNSGDSGLPTSSPGRCRAGVSAGDIAWPVPKKIPIGTLANYGYEGTVLLPVPLTVAPDFKPSLLARRPRRQAQGLLAGLPQGMHPRGRRVRAEAAGAQLHRAAQGRPSMPRLPRSPPPLAQRRIEASRDRRQRAAGHASQACPPRCAARRWSSSPKPAR